jgi:hypothetical protein
MIEVDVKASAAGRCPVQPEAATLLLKLSP